MFGDWYEFTQSRLAGITRSYYCHTDDFTERHDHYVPDVP
jgi:hypothetical protein